MERWAEDDDYNIFTLVSPSPKQRYSRQLEEVINLAKARQSRESITAADGAECYAYPHQAGIAWGINAADTGANILRGIRQPDGEDIAVS